MKEGRERENRSSSVFEQKTKAETEDVAQSEPRDEQTKGIAKEEGTLPQSGFPEAHSDRDVLLVLVRRWNEGDRVEKQHLTRVSAQQVTGASCVVCCTTQFVSFSGTGS